MKVLIVEDDLDSVHTLAALVRHFGHSVEYAINGYAALEVARQFKPQVVLLDLGLPGIDGYEVCSRLRRESGKERTRIVVLSAHGSDEHRSRARAAGCDLHLVKPASPLAILDALNS